MISDFLLKKFYIPNSIQKLNPKSIQKPNPTTILKKPSTKAVDFQEAIDPISLNNKICWVINQLDNYPTYLKTWKMNINKKL